LGFQRELSETDTSENGWETCQAQPAKKFNPISSKSQQSYQRKNSHSLFEGICYGGADGCGFIAPPAGQHSAPSPTSSYSPIYQTNSFSSNMKSEGPQQLTPSPSDSAPQIPQQVNVLPQGAAFHTPSRQANPRPTRRYQRPVRPDSSQDEDLNFGSYVLFKVGNNPITHIDAGIHNTDPLFSDELKRVYKSERGWLREWLSIWRYHHCNFDKVIDPLYITACPS
jgi:hypothetical protein